MHINKLIAINLSTNILVYETDNEIVTKRNQIVFFIEFKSNNRIVVVGKDNRFELEHFDVSLKQLFVNDGFIQINDNTFVNANIIAKIVINKQLVELSNHLVIPYTSNFKSNIDNFLLSLNAK